MNAPLRDLRALGLLVALTTAVAGWTGGSAAIADEAGPATVQWLFVQTASTGKLVPAGGERSRLTLTVRGDTTSFTDRPARAAALESTAEFVKQWDARGFADVPPNAAVVVDNAPADRDVIVVELSKPRFVKKANALTFKARRIKPDEAPASLARFAKRADSKLARTFGSASVFIDSATPEPTVQLEFEVNVPGSPDVTDQNTVQVTFDQPATIALGFAALNWQISNFSDPSGKAPALISVETTTFSVSSDPQGAEGTLTVPVVPSGSSVTFTPTLPAGTQADVVYDGASTTLQSGVPVTLQL